MRVPHEVSLNDGVRADATSVNTVNRALARLRAADPVALFALREHALDAGYPLTPATRRVLRRHGLASADGVDGHTRATVVASVTGQGLALDITPRPRGRAGAASRDGSATARDSSGPDELVTFVRDRAARGAHAEIAAELRRLARAMATSVVDADAMLRWTAAAATLRDERGAATPELERLLKAARKLFDATASPAARAMLFDLAAASGARIGGPVPLPLRRVPYWQKEAHPLEGYQSTPRLPARADVVIVGSGLIGGSAALHLADAVKSRGLRVVMLEAGEVSSQATGRNGGNIEAIPENFFGAYGTYDGFVQERLKFLTAAYPWVSADVRLAQARRIAETIIRFAHANAKLLLEDARREGIEADVSTSGWLRLALNAREERALKDEVAFGRRLGVDMRVIGPAEISRRYGLASKYAGRLVLGNGNFHPFKFVVQEVARAVEKGVRLYTRTRVRAVESTRADRHLVRTDRGDIVAKRVIVAVNAFTSELFPQLDAIRPFRSQIVNYNHVDNTLRGITFTAKDGDIYGNFPKQDWYTRGRRSVGTLHLGGGLDTPFEGPWHARPSSKVYRLIVDEATQVFPQLHGRAPVRTWAGPMAFVEGPRGQRMPAIGELGDGAERGALITVWCNGYGGTGCHKTGAEAARWALEGRLSGDVPEDVFGVKRLLSDEPLFDPERGGPRTPGRTGPAGRGRRRHPGQTTRGRLR